MALVAAKLSDEDVAWLRARPWYEPEVYDPLQKIVAELSPGSHVVAFHCDMAKLCAKLIVALNPTPVIIKDEKTQLVMRPGTPGDSHNNVSKLFVGRMVRDWMQGYALDIDGRWRNHSWGLDNQGRVVETTDRRLIYLGIQIACLA